MYDTGPLTKASMLQRMNDGRPVDPNFQNKFRIRRRGKDKDDIFWAFGKIHGLENIALADQEEYVATKGDPFKLQALVDKINDSEKPMPSSTFDKLIEETHNNMNAYKQSVDKNKNNEEFNPSDRKKLLALPFLLGKRSELPEPKKG